MAAAAPAPANDRRHLLAFAVMSASYFTHIGFFNPYLPLWLKELGMPIFVISLLSSAQSVTRVFAPYVWGAISDHTGQRVKLLRYSSAVALVASFGLWWNGGEWWVGLVLLLLFTHTSSMMSLTEAAIAHLVNGDWGKYGRIRLWGSAGFLVTVLVAGWAFQQVGMSQFPAWASGTLLVVLIASFRLPDIRDPIHAGSKERVPILPVLRQPAVRWFFASLFFQVTSHFAIYGFLSLYLDSIGYGKTTIGVLWALSVALEILWFFWQGRWIGKLAMSTWLVVCGVACVLRMGLIAGLGTSILALVVAQALHGLSFAAHHSTCIAMVSRHFPGRLRGRGQALFTVIGYGIGGVIGMLAGGAVAQRYGFVAMYAAAAMLALCGTACAWRSRRLAVSLS